MELHKTYANETVAGSWLLVTGYFHQCAILAVIYQLKENGNVKGERYSRKIVKDKTGQIVRDHWDRKGRST